MALHVNQGSQHTNQANLDMIGFICTSLETVISKSFGPLGLQNLLTTDTGQVMVTSDGLSTLQTLHLSHPIAKLIVDSLTKLSSHTGDGCKTFVLCLAQAVREIEKQMNSNHRQTHIQLQNETRIKFCTAFQNILVDLMPTLTQYIEDRLSVSVGSSTVSSHKVEIKKLIKSSLLSHFPIPVTDTYTKLLLDLLKVEEGMSINNFQKYLQNICDSFSQLCIKVPSLPYTSSVMMSSFLIQRDFAVLCNNLQREDVKFLIVQCSIEVLQQNKTLQESVHITNSEQLKQFMNHQVKKAEEFIKMCKQNEISLLLSSEKIPDFVLSMFKKNDISVVHYVLTEDLTFLQIQTGQQAIVNMYEVISDVNIFTAQSVKTITVGSKKFVHIVMADMPEMLLVCGLSEKFCGQILLGLQKALLKLTHCFIVDCCSSDQKEVTKNVKCCVHNTENETGGIYSVPRNKDVTDLPISSAVMHVTRHTENETTSVCHISSQDMLHHVHRSNMHFIYGGGLFELVAAKYFEDQSRKFRADSDYQLRTACLALSYSLLNVSRTLYQNMSSTKNSNFLTEQQKTFRLLTDLSSQQSETNRSAWINHCLVKAGDCVESSYCKVHMLSCVIQLLKQLLRIDSVLGITH